MRFEDFLGMKWFQKWEIIFPYPSPTTSPKTPVKDHPVHDKDRYMKMNVIEYQKPLKLPKIKVIFQRRWIQNLPWLRFLVLFHATMNELPTLPLYFCNSTTWLLVVPIIHATLQPVKRNTIAHAIMLLEFLSTNVDWVSTLCQDHGGLT